MIADSGKQKLYAEDTKNKLKQKDRAISTEGERPGKANQGPVMTVCYGTAEKKPRKGDVRIIRTSPFALVELEVRGLRCQGSSELVATNYMEYAFKVIDHGC